MESTQTGGAARKHGKPHQNGNATEPASEIGTIAIEVRRLLKESNRIWAANEIHEKDCKWNRRLINVTDVLEGKARALLRTLAFAQPQSIEDLSTLFCVLHDEFQAFALEYVSNEDGSEQENSVPSATESDVDYRRWRRNQHRARIDALFSAIGMAFYQMAPSPLMDQEKLSDWHFGVLDDELRNFVRSGGTITGKEPTKRFETIKAMDDRLDKIFGTT